MKILYIGFWLALAIIGIVFAALNADSVTLNYHFGQIHLPVSLVVSIALLIGACLGALASLGLVFRTRREMARLKKQAAISEKEVLNLRAIPLRDKH